MKQITISMFSYYALLFCFGVNTFLLGRRTLPTEGKFHTYCNKICGAVGMIMGVTGMIAGLTK